MHRLPPTEVETMMGGIPNCPLCRTPMRIRARQEHTTATLDCPGCGLSVLYNPKQATWFRLRSDTDKGRTLAWHIEVKVGDIRHKEDT